jgi:hypothetical protein
VATYQKTVFSTGVSDGQPGALPAFLYGLPDAILAELPEHLDPVGIVELGLEDRCFVRVADPEPEPPPAPRWIHKALFKRRFTQAERIAIRLAETDEAVPLQARLALVDFREVLDATENVYLDDVDVIAGLDLLVTLGLIGAQRPAQIRE